MDAEKCKEEGFIIRNFHQTLLLWSNQGRWKEGTRLLGGS